MSGQDRIKPGSSGAKDGAKERKKFFQERWDGKTASQDNVGKHDGRTPLKELVDRTEPRRDSNPHGVLSPKEWLAVRREKRVQPGGRDKDSKSATDANGVTGTGRGEYISRPREALGDLNGGNATNGEPSSLVLKEQMVSRQPGLVEAIGNARRAHDEHVKKSSGNSVDIRPLVPSRPPEARSPARRVTKESERGDAADMAGRFVTHHNVPRADLVVPPGNLPKILERRVKRGIRGWFAKYIYSWLPWRKAPTQNLLKMPSGPTDGRLTLSPIPGKMRDSGETGSSEWFDHAMADVRQKLQEDADRNGLGGRFSRINDRLNTLWNIRGKVGVTVGLGVTSALLGSFLVSSGGLGSAAGGAATGVVTFAHEIYKSREKLRRRETRQDALKDAAKTAGKRAAFVFCAGFVATGVAHAVSDWWNGDIAASEEVSKNTPKPAAVADITEAPKEAQLEILNALESDAPPDNSAAHEMTNRFTEEKNAPALALKETPPWDISDSAEFAPAPEPPLEDSASSVPPEVKPSIGENGGGQPLSEYTVQPGDAVAKTGLDGYIKTQLFTNDSFPGLSSGAKAQFIEAFRDTLAENRNFADQLVTTSGGKAVFNSVGDLIVRAGDTFNPALLKDPKFLEALAQNIAEDQKKYLLPELGGEDSLENLKYRLAVLAGK